MSSIVLYLTKRGILKAVIIAFSFIMIYDSVDLRSFRPISALCSKNNPRNINYMPAVIFFACPVCVPACACPHLSAVQAAQAGADRQRTGRLDFERKSS